MTPAEGIGGLQEPPHPRGRAGQRRHGHFEEGPVGEQSAGSEAELRALELHVRRAGVECVAGQEPAVRRQDHVGGAEREREVISRRWFVGRQSEQDLACLEIVNGCLAQEGLAAQRFNSRDADLGQTAPCSGAECRWSGRRVACRRPAAACRRSVRGVVRSERQAVHLPLAEGAVDADGEEMAVLAEAELPDRFVVPDNCRANGLPIRNPRYGGEKRLPSRSVGSKCVKPAAQRPSALRATSEKSSAFPRTGSPAVPLCPSWPPMSL